MPNLPFTDISIRALKPSRASQKFFDTKTPGFGIRVGRTVKTWVVMRGKSRELLTIGRYPELSLADAKAKAKKLLASEPEPKIPRRSFVGTRDAYLAQHFKGSSDHKYHIELIFKKHFAALEGMQLGAITDRDVETCLEKIAGPSAKLHAFRAIRTFFNWCVKSPRRYIPISPTHGYEAPGTDKKGTRTLTDHELNAVWMASEGSTRLVFRLLILWGTRNAETVAIERSWVEEDVLVIPGSKTKNGRDHAIPLLPLARSILVRRNTDPYYFPGRNNDEHITAHSLAKVFREIKKEAGLSGFTIRDIRRTFRSNMAKLKVPREIAEVLINHAPPVLDEIYDRYDRIKEKRQALAKYEKFITSLLTKRGES